MRNVSRRQFVRGCAAATAVSMLRGRAFAADSLAADTNRPQYHLLPADNWMNDPNGPIFWKDKYHMFFQYNPHAAVWGDMHWAHATSPDMVHWTHLPVALAPTKGGPDADGCFSGSAVLFNGVPTFLYTGVRRVPIAEATIKDARNPLREAQCLATSSDPELRTWKKLPKPVIPAPPGLDITGFRDPCLWQDAGVWYMGVGSGIRNHGGCVLLYRSHDLRRWEYLHPLVSGEWNGKAGGDPVDSGEMWECPDFFALDGKHVLLYSTQRRVYWMSGEYDSKGQVFHPQQKGELDYGPRAYYAPKSMLDKDGNRILWGWIPETRPEADYSRAGWAGLMSLPRLLSVNAEGQLKMRVLPRLQELRAGEPIRWPADEYHLACPLDPSNGRCVELPLRGLCAELDLRAQPAKDMVHVIVRSRSKPALYYQFDPRQGVVSINANGISTGLPAGEMRVHLFLDGSVVEMFVNERSAFTSRIYDLDPEHATLTILDPGHAVADAQLWRISPISSNRLTT